MKNMVTRYSGKLISAVALQDDALTIRFADGTGLVLRDDGQDCCETRYMDSDDDLSEIVGGVLYGVEVRDVSQDIEARDDFYHEIQFLVVKTSKGDLTVCTHNEHNGYYGGFSIVAVVMS